MFCWEVSTGGIIFWILGHFGPFFDLFNPTAGEKTKNFKKKILRIYIKTYDCILKLMIIGCFLA